MLAVTLARVMYFRPAIGTIQQPRSKSRYVNARGVTGLG